MADISVRLSRGTFRFAVVVARRSVRGPDEGSRYVDGGTKKAVNVVDIFALGEQPSKVRDPKQGIVS